MAKLGIIGGSGLYGLPELSAGESILLDTPFGQPSSPPRTGVIGDTEVVFIARHGDGHVLSPTCLPYRANVFALKQLGVTHVLSVSAVGSLRENLPPRSVVLPDQIIDRTLGRDRTFFDEGIVAHVGLADPFCPILRGSIADAAPATAPSPHPGGIYVCIEGPQFSTRAESHLYRSWGATVIGMTAMPEARLAREAELCYATIALVTDYDVWHDEETEVSVELVLGHLRANVAVAGALIRATAERGLPDRVCGCKDALRDAVMTAPDQITAAQRQRLGVIGSGRIPIETTSGA
ncbi:MAG: 5'-methylthioadenosine phosphorylase [uncultured Thermomicrobiales bacterium]|uniref:S-methyl-5'-thioadenosine phosphorylase n=1 Tax=uncultured Thermomicrobiales bacterium TaxID=1645740 RepID=A0A6J4UKP6_9BACT|nr:MAG: 5'-methylthioadenosine phosphorylase [uncultured Thermomicrobiales bacterium]